MRAPQKHNTLDSRLIEYFISKADINDVARKLNLEYNFVYRKFKRWEADRQEVKREVERDNTIFSAFIKTPNVDFALVTNSEEVRLAYHRMINPPKKKAA